jgi:hypothetical protein
MVNSEWHSGESCSTVHGGAREESNKEKSCCECVCGPVEEMAGWVRKAANRAGGGDGEGWIFHVTK